MRRWNLSSEDGSASIEFLGVGIILLVPLIYLVLALSAVQSAVLAAEGTARQAARAFVSAENSDAAYARLEHIVAVGMSNADAELHSTSVDIECSREPCLQRGGLVVVSIDATVPLPFMPPIFGLDRTLSIPVHAEATQTVSRFTVAP